MGDIQLNYNTLLEMDVSGGAYNGTGPTWATVGTGWNDFDEAVNEVLNQASYLNDEGWGHSDVSGGQLTVSLNGERIAGDTVQDYIFSDTVKYGFGKYRKTKIRITRENGSKITWDVTLAKIKDGSGESQKIGAVSVEIHGNGAPTIVTGSNVDTLVIVSLAGTGAGKSSIYVNPVKGASNSLKFKVTSDLPEYDQVLTTGWTALTAGADAITSGVTTGDVICVAEVTTSGNYARKAGFATVTTG